jgi:hypothetical protein
MRIAWCGLLLALGTVAGCIEFPLLTEGTKVPPADMRQAPAPVTADQVNEGNAYEKAAALQKELDGAARQEAAPKAPGTKVLP